MNDREFEIGGKKFQLNKVNAIKQFHIVRRMAPILTKMVPSIGKIKDNEKSKTELSDGEKLEHIAEVAIPFMDGFAKLSDADSEIVLYGLLSCVQVQQAGNWAWVVVNSNLMFDDLDLPTMLQIAYKSFMFNLSGFFRVLPQVS